MRTHHGSRIMTNRPSKKEFDCIAVKREAQAQIYEEIKDQPPEQEIEYFRRAIETSRIRQWWETASTMTFGRLDEAS